MRAGPGFSKVLVCDDDRAFRQRLARSLRSAGYTVFEAEDATSGLETALEYRPNAKRNINSESCQPTRLGIDHESQRKLSDRRPRGHPR